MTAQNQSQYWKTNKHPRSPFHPISRFFSQQRWDFLGRYVNLTAVTSVLDVGCGKGLASLCFEDTSIFHVGVDFSAEQLAQIELTTLQKAISAGEKLPFPDSSFDLVMCWEVLHHVDDPAAVVAEMARVSKLWVIIFEPNMFNPGQLLFSVVVWAERGSLKLRRSIIENALSARDFSVAFFGKVGWVFPNRAPVWLFNILRKMPFRFPIFGISRLWIAQKEGEAKSW
jgi:SAM-dependent methyltransferase